MKRLKNFFRFIAFLFSLIVILQILSYIFVPKDNTESSGMENVSANGILGEKENTIDVLFLGDSEAYSSFCPMEIWKDTGYTSYVCATPGQSLNYTAVLLSRAFESQKPKYVFLETNAIYRSVSSGEETLTTLSNHFSVFQYHDRWKSLNINNLFNSSFSWNCESKGYIQNHGIIPSDSKGYMKKSKAVEKIASRNAEYISWIKEFCDENGAKLVLISTPSTVNWNYAKHNGVQIIAQELGCDFFDLNLKTDVLKIDWTKDTRDAGDHLNHSGAVKVTNYISAYLRGTGIFIDHRGDQRFKQWEDALKKYKTESLTKPNGHDTEKPKVKI